MKHALYKFSDVLRAVRIEADLTVLEAATLTGYTNYERWESGQTRVKADYLETIAEVFGIEGQLWLLTYAWLLDRYAPQPGERRFEFSQKCASTVLRTVPKARVELEENDRVDTRPLTHGHLALMCLIARYGPSYAGADVPLALPPMERSSPTSISASDSVLDHYADVLADLMRYVARTFLVAGSEEVDREIRLVVVRHTLLLLAEPESFWSLFASSAPASGGPRRGLDGLAAFGGRSAPKLRRIAERELEELRGCWAAAKGRQVTLDEFTGRLRELVHEDELWERYAEGDEEAIVATLKERIAADDRRWLGTEDWPVERVVPHLPEPDPGLVAELQELRDDFDRRYRRASQQELADACAVARPAAVLEASRSLER